ncbi:TrmH family RNA methyltransferase [Enterococcus sp. PF1-24]|uniref:TrmH family RNA methyltransferase n=1 Tax=unclassified Enterococcus TaxID=2608891 RepID=UPI002475E292|nr:MULTISPECIES: RNA methyltransferase [unclassified Enterococcus]MDH6365130.1 TrmH family RNA methyltransferase [Enterococcus sp. PFB1-1]MDH6402231.1 TrmH family RNA methyltransferase [Enterococcus sp. PF1-24]
MKEILSVKNQWIKELKKYQKRKYRQLDQKYLLEGFHLIEEAVKGQAPVEAILVTQRGMSEWGSWLAEFPEEKLYFVSDEVMKQLSELPTPQGILAVVAMTNQAEITFAGKWLLLDNVQDPGNVGTMIRTADIFGFTGVVLGEGTADIYNPKVLRSMQGSQFHLPIIQKDLQTAIKELKAFGSLVYGTELNEEAVALNAINKTTNLALIMGNEGQGVQKELLTLTDKNIYIPIKGQAESLNVAIAAGILMYELA